MTDKSNWKNTNRDILRNLLKGVKKAMPIEEAKKYIKPFTEEAKKAEKILKGKK